LTYPPPLDFVVVDLGGFCGSFAMNNLFSRLILCFRLNLALILGFYYLYSIHSFVFYDADKTEKASLIAYQLQQKSGTDLKL
jgi:hypothetical protein